MSSCFWRECILERITVKDLHDLLHCHFFSPLSGRALTRIRPSLIPEELSKHSEFHWSKPHQSIHPQDPAPWSDIQLCLRRVSQTWTGGSCANLHGSQSHGILERDVPQREHDTFAFPTFALNWAHMDQGWFAATCHIGGWALHDLAQSHRAPSCASHLDEAETWAAKPLTRSSTI